MTDIAGIGVARIEIRLPEASIRAKAGSTLENPVTLVNLTPLPDFFYLASSGIPAAWASFDKESVNLFPNWSDLINLTLAVPAGTRPGSYILEIDASSHTQDNVKSSIKLEVVVEGETARPGQPPAPEMALPQTSPDGGTPDFTAGHPEPNSAYFQPENPPPFALAPEFPRLQLDLDFGELVIPGGQTAEQIAHLLNLGDTPQNFTMTLEGLPPEWITVQPPVLYLSPNWSEAAHLKITVPVDAIPGRYLIGVIAIPENPSQLPVWRQFDIVILPPILPNPPMFSPDGVKPFEGTPEASASPIAHEAQPENSPVAQIVPQFEVVPINQYLPVAPIVEQVAPPVWNSPILPAIAPVPETPKPEPKQRSGLFGWKKKKAEPVQPEPILFVPLAPVGPSSTTPLPESAFSQPETIRPVVAESVVVPPASTETVLSFNPPLTSVEPETKPVVQSVESAEQLSGQEINSPIDEVITKAPSNSLPDTITTGKIEEQPDSEVNPALNELDPTVQAGIPVAVPALVEAPAPVVLVEPEAVEDGTALEPAVVKTENLELGVENIKIRFELGTFSEQQVSLVNLMNSPAFFDLKVEGLPETWYSFSYSQINLFPNWREQVYFRLEAPTDTTPGLFPATLVVTSPNLPGAPLEIALDIEVLPSAILADKLYRATGNGQAVTLTPDARIELVLNTVNLTFVPGEELEQTVALVNYSPIPDLFELKLEGLLESWYQLSTPAINLFPNWKEEFYLRIALPLNAVPGLYPVRVLVKGRNYPELHTEQSLLLQILLPPPEPVVVQEPAPETEEEYNPTLGDAETANRSFSGVIPVGQTQEPAPATETVIEEEDASPAQPFSFASFFQQQNLVPGAVTPAPEPTSATNLPVVPPVPDAAYNQPTSAVPATGEAASYITPAAGNEAKPNNPFEKRPTIKMGQQTPSVLAPQASLAGIFPVITAQPEAPAPEPVEQEEPATPIVPARKRTFWQRVTGQGKDKPAPVTPRLDENVLWRSAQSQTPAQNHVQPVAYTSNPVSTQATQGNRQNQTGNVATSAGEYPAIGGSSQPAQTGQRAYSPMSTGGDVARVQITLEKPHMTIVAGESASQQIFLMNLTSLPDNFELTIEGLPANWFSFENSTINLFPNWNEHTALTLNISDKVKPDLYKGRIAVAASAQTGVKAVMPIEIQVLAPLVVQARLQPHRGKGYKASYEMLLRNRSMSEGLMTMQWAHSNEFSAGTFNPPTVVLAPGQSERVKLQVMLRKKTPSDQARQAQPFKVMVQPQWTVAQAPVVTAPVSVEGEYMHRSRWVFIQRHPVMFAFLTIILVIVLLWNLLLLPFIQNTLMALSLDKVSYSDVAAKTLSADQLGFNIRLKEANPLAALVPTDVSFVEAPDKNPKGLITIRMQAFVFTATLTGSLQVDPVSGDLQFVPEIKNQVGSFPWFFIPPDKVVLRLSGKLKTWLRTQNPPQRLDDVYIEGNTVFLKIRNCQTGEVACQPGR